MHEIDGDIINRLRDRNVALAIENQRLREDIAKLQGKLNVATKELQDARESLHKKPKGPAQQPSSFHRMLATWNAQNQLSSPNSTEQIQ